MGGRGFPDDARERSGEGSQASVPDCDRDVGYRQCAGSQQPFGAFDPAPIQIFMRRFSENRFELPREVRGRHVRNCRSVRHIQRFRIVPIHGVAGAKQSTCLRIRMHSLILRRIGSTFKWRSESTASVTRPPRLRGRLCSDGSRPPSLLAAASVGSGVECGREARPVARGIDVDRGTRDLLGAAGLE